MKKKSNFISLFFWYVQRNRSLKSRPKRATRTLQKVEVKRYHSWYIQYAYVKSRTEVSRKALSHKNLKMKLTKQEIKQQVLKQCWNYLCSNRQWRYSKNAVCPTCRKRIKKTIEMQNKAEILLSKNTNEINTN